MTPRNGVTDVVRGADLLPSTAWQIAPAATRWQLPTPRYAHLPLVVEQTAKSSRNPGIPYLWTRAAQPRYSYSRAASAQHPPPTGVGTRHAGPTAWPGRAQLESGGSSNVCTSVTARDTALAK